MAESAKPPEWLQSILDRLDLMGNQIAELQTPRAISSTPQTAEEDENVTLRRSTRSQSRKSGIFDQPRGTELLEDKAVSIVYQPYQLKQEQKMSHLTASSVLWLIRQQYLDYKATARQTGVQAYNLVHFIEQRILMKLVAKQKELGSTLASLVSVENIYGLDDEVIEEMLVSCIRPVTREGYTLTLKEGVSKFYPTHIRGKPKPQKDSWPTWQIRDFDEILAEGLSNLVNAMKDLDKMLRYKAPHETIQIYPEMEYGSARVEGVFRIMLQLLHPYGQNLMQLIGEAKLKAMKDLAQFIEAVESEILLHSRKAKELRHQEAKSEPPRTAKEILDEAESRDLQKRLKLGSEEKRGSTFKVMADFEADKNLHGRDDTLAAAFGQHGIPDTRGDVISRARTQGTLSSKTQPCYSEIRQPGGCSAGASCIYSHDPTVLAKFINSELEILTRSKYFDKSKGLPPSSV